MHLHGCILPSDSEAHFTAESGTGRYTSRGGQEWRIGDALAVRGYVHPSGVFADYHNFGYMVSRRERCSCGVKFWKHRARDINRYCCRQCIISGGTIHSSECSHWFQ